MTKITTKTGLEENGNLRLEAKKLPYPKSVFFIVVTEFCERFAYYGFRAVLTIYMRNVLNFSEDLSTTVYHIFLFLCYFLPIFGAILSDSFFGKYYTVYAFSSIFAIGNIILTASATPPLQLPTVQFAMLGLFLMAVGTGGIKPCVAPLGGDQFILPQQSDQLKKFFSVFTFAVSIGNMASTVVTPVLRSDVSCFDRDCYPLAFGVPSTLMVFALVIFVCGKKLYRINRPKDNIILRVFQCVTHAISQKQKYKKKEKYLKSISQTDLKPDEKKHWIDYASYDGSKFDKQLIADTKGLFRVLKYYLPIPVFWSLLEQLGSRWTLQATKMDGTVGNFRIKPDQMQVANAVLMLIFIPVFETVVYPLLRKCNLLKRPLQRMTVGSILAALSFVLAGVTETYIEKYVLEKPGMDETHLNIINTLNCPLRMRIEGQSFLANEVLDKGKEQFDIVFPQSNFILRSIMERNVTLSLAVTLRSSSKCFPSLSQPSSVSASSSPPPTALLLQQNQSSKLQPLLFNSNVSSSPVNTSQQKQYEKQETLFWSSQIPISALSGTVQSIIISSAFTLSSSETPTAAPATDVVRNSSKIMIEVRNLEHAENIDKSRQGDSKLTVYNLANIKTTTEEETETEQWRRIKIVSLSGSNVYLSKSINTTDSSWTVEVVPNTYKVYVETPEYNNVSSSSGSSSVNWKWQGLQQSIKLQPGGNYILVLQNENDGEIKSNLVNLVPPNEVHMLFLLPQYMVMAWAEILFIISGMEFSFTEAPVSMKSVLQSCWHLTNAAGNLMVIISAQIRGNYTQATEFLVFAALMAADTIIFAIMATRYKYVSHEPGTNDNPNPNNDQDNNLHKNSITLNHEEEEEEKKESHFNGNLKLSIMPLENETSQETRL